MDIFYFRGLTPIFLCFDKNAGGENVKWECYLSGEKIIHASLKIAKFYSRVKK